MATRIRNPLRRLIGLASLGAAYAQSEVTAPIYATGAHDLFLKGRAGTAGGSVSGQVAASAGLTLGRSATFTVKLQNDSATTSTTGVVIVRPDRRALHRHEQHDPGDRDPDRALREHGLR